MASTLTSESQHVNSPSRARPRVAVAGLVNLVGAGLGAVIGLLLAALVGRELGTEGAGTYFLVVAVFYVASQIGELGADTGLVRFVAAYDATGRGRAVPALIRSAVRPVILTSIAVTTVCAVAVVVDPDIVPVLPAWLVVVTAAICGASSLFALLLGVLRGYHDALSYPALQNISLPILRLAGVAAAIALGADASGAVLAWMLAVLPVVAIAAWLARKAVRRHVAGTDPAEADTREFWRFSAARGFSSAVEVSLEWADVIIVGALTSVESAGIYAVVTRCARIGEVVQQAARVVVAPSISAALARGERDTASDIYGSVAAAMVWLAWPFYAVGIVFAETILGLFGEGFAEGATALRILLIAMAIATAAGTAQSVLLMGGRSMWQLYDKTGALALNIVLNLILVPVWGIEGAAVAWATTLIVDTLVVVFQVQVLMHVRARVAPIAWASVLAIVVAGGGAWLGRSWCGESLHSVFGTTAVTALVYIAVGAVLRYQLGVRRLMELR